MINDSELFHGNYDPEKARAYYLRTRKLKGRRPGSSALVAPSRGGSKPSSSIVSPAGGVPNRSKTKSRQAELRAQKEALEKRLDRLREVLSELVAAAKKRSGGDPNSDKKDETDAAPETKVDKADRNKAEKDAKPLTSKQKSDKAKQAKEAYEKEHPNTLSTDVDILKEQVKDIQSKIEAALKSARARQENAGLKSEIVQPKKTNNDEPKGR